MSRARAACGDVVGLMRLPVMPARVLQVVGDLAVLFVLIRNETGNFSVTTMVHHSPDREGPVRISVENEQMALSFDGEFFNRALVGINEIRSTSMEDT